MARGVLRRSLLGAAAGGLAGCVASSAGGVGSGGSVADLVDGRRLLVELDRLPDEIIPLWPDGAPGGEGVDLTQHYVERDNPFGLRDRAIHDVINPTLSLFRAREPDGSAILIIPGGGYRWVVVEKEGYEGARYFNRFGADVYVMDYRLPHQGWAAGPDAPLQDAQRAMRLIRARAEHGRIMVMGFSAGGHLAGSLCQRFDAEVYSGVDAADDLSARPDLGVLVYPVVLMRPPYAHEGSRRHLIGENPAAELYAKYDLSGSPNPAGPPLFLLHTLDDEAVPVENTLRLANAARAAGVSTALHVFERGGHGFGLRGIDEKPVGVWPQLVIDWARGHEF